ncbi:hypothetical protein I4U23_017301 [Adineta vaga]|nr:hypothetical protein I4U23_017301 [Adineta vaga]
MNESLINHLFLPYNLPCSSDDDYLLKKNHENEYKLLEYINEYFDLNKFIYTKDLFPFIDIFMTSIQRWSILQNPQTLFKSQFRCFIEELKSGDFLPLYFHNQNASILIEIDEINDNSPLISSWQVLLSPSELTSSFQNHYSYFPIEKYRLLNRSQLISDIQCELLMDFMLNPIEYSKSYKCSYEVNEIRDIPQSHYNIYQWLNVSPHSIKLKPFSNLPQNTKVKLISSTKSISQSHYFSPSISTSCIEDFIYENTLKVEITPSKPIDFNEESHLLTPKIDHSKYKQLEFTLENTEFNCNDIIAQSVNCSSEFQRNEFIEYGSFRCGHYLQWWNLLTILEMNSLSISEENVVILIVHSIFQYGPFNDQSLTFPWCSQSHRQLLEDDFVKEFLQRLQYHLDQYECDEILHVKYQLIYTIGNQQDIDGGEQRWFIIQIILSLVKKYIQDVKNEFNEEVYYKLSERKSSFPHIRFQTLKSFLSLSDKIVNDWINTKNYNDIEKQEIYFFIFNKESSIENLIHQYSSNDIQFFLIFRAFISSEILFFALKKRYRVNYGIHTNSSLNRLMAVPFRAKDVPTDKTEFAHPDLAILLTQFSYYYSGLTIQQFLQCLNHLNEKSNESSIIFHQWINYEDDQSISNDIKIYFNDYQTRIYVLYPILRFNMLVINYYLNHFVYPQEMKQYSNKIIASSWDLSSSIRSHMTIGFSGTSDTQLLLPIYVQQYNLSQLDKTDAIVLNNLFQCQNENYHTLSINANSDDILQEIVNSKQMINVILDVGALFLDGNNRDIALKWLNLSDKNKICYVVYFESDLIYVCNRSNQEQLFVTSSASERFDECLFYLDEIHTRGSDFKFPKGFHAAVTLGNDLTKDRFVQACMRMRKLGNGHSLTFWSSFEVHQQIQKNEQIHLIDILRWLYKNTIESTWDNLYHWIIQSLSFQKKIQGFRQIQWNNCEQIFTGMIIKQIARKCSQTELIDLKNIPFEANHFINYINSCSQTTRSMTTLRLFLPRIREHQSIFINTSSLIIPSINNAFHFNILLEDLIELFLFNGNLFFQNSNEQTAFCRYLGLCPKPRSTIEEKFYAKGHIDIEGFVIDRMQRRHLQLSQCPFRSNPLSFIRKFIENRNNSNVPLTSHVGSIIYNSMKLIQ